MVTGCYGIYLHTIIEESHTTLSVDLHLGYIFGPIPMLEGIRMQEGSLHTLSSALGTTSVAAFSVVTFVGGA